jgi:hypothetical protein
MRISTLLNTAAAVAALAISASAFAAPVTAPAGASAAVMEVQLINGSAYKLRPEEFADVQGKYDLNDGTVLRVAAEHRRLYAEIDGGARVEMVPVGRNTFVANGKRVTFDQIPFASSVTIASAAR